ncbi:acyltransferase domain-containing protein, partial [Streptomyces sp. NPDC018957]
TNHPRRAAISAFGVSGTNAHTILEQAPTPTTTTTPAEATTPHQTGPLLLPLSAKTPNALHHQAKRLHTHLIQHPELPVAEVAHTLALHRTHFTERAALITDDRDELLAALQALAEGKPHPHLVTGTAHDGKTVFVFPGQGSQYEGMARELFAASPVFAEHLTATSDAIRTHAGWNLIDVLHERPGAPSLDRVDVVQPALFAVMVSLARLWQHHGITPDAVIGHSQGEIAAAHIAGALTLDDAVRVVTHRAKAIVAITGTGGMASVPLPVEEVRSLLGSYEDLHIAAHNSPASTVVAGDADALAHLVVTLNDQEIRARTIPVDYASHTPHVHALRDTLLTALDGIAPRTSDVTFYSTLTNGPLDTAKLTAEYWYRNLANPVLFEPATRALLTAGPTTFVEVSPHPVLTTALQETAESQTAATEADASQTPGTIAVVPTLRRDHDDLRTLLIALATAHTHGHPLNWKTINPTTSTTSLPTYPFQHKPYWLTPTTTQPHPTTNHPFLHTTLHLADTNATLLTGTISTTTHPWLTDHTIHTTPLLPATAFLDLTLHAAHHTNTPHIQELTLHTPLP